MYYLNSAVKAKPEPISDDPGKSSENFSNIEGYSEPPISISPSDFTSEA
jgi:hypothetical protein